MQMLKRGHGAAMSGGTISVVLVVIILILGFYIVSTELKKQCRGDADCTTEEYCAYDFTCHKKEVIIKTEVHQDLIIPAVILAIALIIAAAYYKGDITLSKKKPEKKAESKRAEDKEEISQQGTLKKERLEIIPWDGEERGKKK